MYVRSVSETDLQTAVAALRDAVEGLIGSGADLADRPELVDALDELETVWC